MRIPRDLDEQIHPVAYAGGQKSEFFPANLRILFSYDRKHSSYLPLCTMWRDDHDTVKTAKNLTRDYGLGESSIRETNLNKFMSHIGKSIF